MTTKLNKGGSMADQLDDFELKAAVLQEAAMRARIFVKKLQCGQVFPGVAPEAAKHYAIGSAGYVIFMRCAMDNLESVQMQISPSGVILAMFREEDYGVVA